MFNQLYSYRYPQLYSWWNFIPHWMETRITRIKQLNMSACIVEHPSNTITSLITRNKAALILHCVCSIVGGSFSGRLGMLSLVLQSSTRTSDLSSILQSITIRTVQLIDIVNSVTTKRELSGTRIKHIDWKSDYYSVGSYSALWSCLNKILHDLWLHNVEFGINNYSSE